MARLLTLPLCCAASALAAADMLPLTRGTYAPVAVPCATASNADLVNYHGGRSAIGVAQASCTIRKLTSTGNVYRIADECRDDRSGDVITGGPTVLTVASPTRFAMNGMSYRLCRKFG